MVKINKPKEKGKGTHHETFNHTREMSRNRDSNFKNKRALHKQRKRIRAITAIALVVIIAIGYKIYDDNRVYTGYRVKNKIELESKSNNAYAEFADYLIKYNNDGISYFTPQGQVWNHAFEMKHPIIDICGSYVVVAEQKSNKVFVFDEKGLKGDMDTNYPIVKVEVASQGVIAALLEDKDANYIEVRDKDGKELVTGKTVLNGDGYPIDFSLSDDGKKMVVSYLVVTGGQAQTRVLFYNFSEIGKNETDRIVGGFNHYKTTIVPKVEFLTNNVAVAVGDNMFTLYSMKEKPEIISEQKFDDEVHKVFYNNKYLGMVFHNSKSKNPYELVVYNLKGKKVFTYGYTREYRNIKFANDNILFFDDLDCKVVSLSGKEKFKDTFTEEIVDMFPLKSKYSYLLVHSGTIQKIKLK